MADEKRYIRNIYANGVPYTIRDEEAQKNIAQLNMVANGLNHELQNMNDIISNNFDSEKTFKGEIKWDKKYRDGSKIPYFTVQSSRDQDSTNSYNTLVIMEY